MDWHSLRTSCSVCLCEERTSVQIICVRVCLCARVSSSEKKAKKKGELTKAAFRGLPSSLQSRVCIQLQHREAGSRKQKKMAKKWDTKRKELSEYYLTLNACSAFFNALSTALANLISAACRSWREKERERERERESVCVCVRMLRKHIEISVHEVNFLKPPPKPVLQPLLFSALALVQARSTRHFQRLVGSRKEKTKTKGGLEKKKKTKEMRKKKEKQRQLRFVFT